ncbi:MAG: hypothetical protein HYZ92_05895 [Candidatus Omnitrophica bacterium]|nr:hypothetical protein [Candidatus Omnitrophota bacterium]
MSRADERLAWAEVRLAEAQRIALRYFGGSIRIERKADRSPVTVADRKIEEFLRRELARAFPGEAIVGEEFGGAEGPIGTTFWTIDPIDGTRAFSRGLPSWGMMLGRVENGRPQLGACRFPAVGVFLGADRDGAYERSGSRKLALPRASTPPALSDAVLFHGGASWLLASPYARGFRRLIDVCYLERAYGDCYGFLWAFRGKVDALIEVGVKIWDLVPFAAMAHATGRVMVDCAGRPTFTGPECVLAHPSLARAICRVLSGTGHKRQATSDKRQGKHPAAGDAVW